MTFKKITAALTALTICASAMPLSISSYYSTNTALAATVGGFDNAIPADQLPEWVPKSYDSAKEYMSKVDTSSTPDEIAFATAPGYIMFVWHVKPENDHGFLFASGEMVKYDNATTNKYEYFNADKTDKYVVHVYNFTSMTQQTAGAAHLTIYNDDERNSLGTYSLSYIANTDLSINTVGIKYSKKIGVDDWEEIAQGGGASIRDGKIYLAFDKSLGDVSLTLNDKECIMAQTSKASSTGKYYYTYKYEPTEAGDLHFVIKTTNSNGETKTSKISLRVDSNLNISQIDSPSDPTDQDEYSWLPKTYAEAENFIKTNGNIAVSADYVIFAYKYSGLMDYNIKSVIDSDVFSFAKEAVICQDLAADDSSDIRFLVYKPKKASDSFLEWHGVNNANQLIDLFYADVTVDSNLKIKLNAESDSSWYPTNAESAKEFMEKYPTGGSVGDTACYVSKDALSIKDDTLLYSFDIKNYKFSNGYTATIVKNTSDKQSTEFVDITYSYEDKNMVVSFESDYDASNNSRTCKITDVKEETDFKTDFETADEFYKKYGNITLTSGSALIVVPVENGSSLPELTVTGNGKATKSYEKILTDGTTTYAVYLLFAEDVGDVNISVPLAEKKFLKAYLLVEQNGSSLKFVSNPNPPQETTEPTETGTGEVIYVKSGDVNLDGNVSIADAVLLNKYLVNSADFSQEQIAAADTYKDEVVDSNDTLTILKFLVMSINQLPQNPQ